MAWSSSNYSAKHRGTVTSGREKALETQVATLNVLGCMSDAALRQRERARGQGRIGGPQFFGIESEASETWVLATSR